MSSNRAMGYFYGGPEDGRIIGLSLRDISRGTLTVRDAHGAQVHYDISGLDPAQPIGDVIATHRLTVREE